MAKDSTIERARQAMIGDIEKLLRLLVKLIIGIYIWALLLSMEVFDFIDIDIEAGDSLPAFGWGSWRRPGCDRSRPHTNLFCLQRIHRVCL